MQTQRIPWEARFYSATDKLMWGQETGRAGDEYFWEGGVNLTQVKAGIPKPHDPTDADQNLPTL